MNSTFRIACALALAASSFPALAATATASRAWQFKPESNAGLAVRNFMGNVRVERGTTPGVHVTATTTIEAPSQAEADRLLKLVEFRTTDVGRGSRFDVRLARADFPKVYSEKGATGWWSNSYIEHLGQRIQLVGTPGDAPAVRIDLLIRAPVGANLDVSDGFGDSLARGFSGTLRLDGGDGLLSSSGGDGPLELDIGSGEAVVEGHRGPVSADTGSGSVRISDCECEISADTGSGSVKVTRGTGSVAADTGSGSVEIVDFAGPIEADTGSGGVKARGVSAVRSLDVDTGSGSVGIDGDLSALEHVNIDTGSGSVRLRSSARPSLELRIDTGSGSVDVNAPGASVREVNDVTLVVLREGRHSGVIDTGSGSVELDFP